MTAHSRLSIWSSSQSALVEACKSAPSLALTEVERRVSPLGGIVFVGTLTLTSGSEAPRELQSMAGRFVRVLDRFYIFGAGDPAAATTLFDAIAERYEGIIDFHRNRRVIAKLIRLCLFSTSSEMPLEILDFGCGPGLAAVVRRELGSRQRRFRLTGTDASPAMIRLATLHGMPTVSLPALELRETLFDCVIASYVLHLGVTDDELRTIVSMLKPGGVFVANYFHAAGGDLSRVNSVLGPLGRLQFFDGSADAGPIIRLTR